MGFSSSKTTSGPSKQALPYLTSASGAVQGAYDANRGNVSDITDALKSTFDAYSPNNPGLTAAGGYAGDVLGGKFLDAGNPYLKGMIDTTNNSVMDRINALFGRNGQTGSSRQIGELGSRLAEAENNLRYADYGAERDRMAQAGSLALGVNSGQNENIQTQAGLGATTAGLPMNNALSLAQALGGLWGNSTTTKTSGGLGQTLMQGLGAAAGAFAASDPRLKRNVERVGDGPSGLSLYAFDYIDAPSEEIAGYMPSGRRVGVMADEVAILRPDALGPVVDGYQTVNYAALGLI